MLTDVILLAKGTAGGLSVVLLVVHMQAAARSNRVASLGHTMRYLALLGLGLLLAVRSEEQINDPGFRWETSTYIASGLAVVVLAAAIRSAWETRDATPWWPRRRGVS